MTTKTEPQIIARLLNIHPMGLELRDSEAALLALWDWIEKEHPELSNRAAEVLGE